MAINNRNTKNKTKNHNIKHYNCFKECVRGERVKRGEERRQRAVSYTHLDVYKRQVLQGEKGTGPEDSAA